VYQIGGRTDANDDVGTAGTKDEKSGERCHATTGLVIYDERWRPCDRATVIGRLSCAQGREGAHMDALTIQCRLVASADTRRHLWHLMADANTPLITGVIARVNEHADFEMWQRRGHLPPGLIYSWVKDSGSSPPYAGQPAYWYLSIVHTVEDIFSSWFALQQRTQRARDGRCRWLEILRDDAQLAEASSQDIGDLRRAAGAALDRIAPKTVGSQKAIDTQLYRALFAAYDIATDEPARCAISVLLKNGGAVPDGEENTERLAARRRATEIRIERLEAQLAARRPRGRDMSGETFLHTLTDVAKMVPEDEAQARSWQDALLREPDNLPFPLVLLDNGKMHWTRGEDKRLRLVLAGMKNHPLAIYGDRRQMHLFDRFAEDQHVQRETHGSSALFTLRSARLAWREDSKRRQGTPWERHRLVLFCTVDTRLWTREGTEEVRREKMDRVAARMARMEKKVDLSETQRGYKRRMESTLCGLDGYNGRPSKPPYAGRDPIVVGVAVGMDRPATVAVVDTIHGAVLAYRSTRQLLGDDYRLLERYRRERSEGDHRRHAQQRRGETPDVGESELGRQVDRLLARAIVDVARQYHAGRIIVPQVGDVREAVEGDMRARAEAQHPGYKDGQKMYAKQYRMSVHRWSFGRLLGSIRMAAQRAGIIVDEGRQVTSGTVQDRARDVALNAHMVPRSLTYVATHNNVLWSLGTLTSKLGE